MDFLGVMLFRTLGIWDMTRICVALSIEMSVEQLNKR
jgi:hypothetical protein